MYPFRVRINDPEIIKVLKRLNRDGYTDSNKRISTCMGYKLRPIRKDLFIGVDNTRGNPGIALKNRDIQIQIQPAYAGKKGWDVVFNLDQQKKKNMFKL